MRRIDFKKYWSKIAETSFINWAKWSWYQSGYLILAVYKSFSQIYTMQGFIYGFIFIFGGVVFLWSGIYAAIQGRALLGSILITIGASVLAVYLADILRKLAIPIPRRKWVQKFSEHNNDFVLYLLGLGNSDTRFKTDRLYSRALGIAVRQPIAGSFGNIIMLEKLIHQGATEFLLDLKNQQLVQIKEYLLNIDAGISAIYQKHGYPFVNREFTQDLDKLESNLKEAIRILNNLKKQSHGSIEITTTKWPRLYSIVKAPHKRLKQRPMLVMYVRQSKQIQLKTNPIQLYAVLRLTIYLESLIHFINYYGYSNNEVISFMKSRESYIKGGH